MRVATLAAGAACVLGTAAATSTSTQTVMATGHGDYVTVKKAKTKRGHSILDPKPGICFNACYLPLNYVRWGDMKRGTYWGSRSRSESWLTSVVACMDAYCTETEAADGWDRLHGFLQFQDQDVLLPPFDTVLARIDLASVPVVDCMDPEAQRDVYNHTILSTRPNFNNGWRTDAAMERQMALHNMFGICIFVLLGHMVFIGLANRVRVFIQNRRSKDVEGGYVSLASNSGVVSDANTWYKKHIGTPAVGGKRHLQPAWWGFLSLPTRLEAVTIAAYVLINIVFCVVQYDLFYDNMYWYGQLDIQFARYSADRTGIMCFYNLVLLWALAGRNDVIIWLTGWSFQSMNLFHRWAARVATFQAIAHSIGYGYIGLGRWSMLMHARYWYTGVYSTIAMVSVLLLSIRPLRVKLYEIFLLLHIWVSIGVLVLLYHHVEMFGYEGFILLCGGIWAFDRLLRVGRVLLLNTKVISAPNATARLTTPGGLVRLSVDTSLPLTPRPGDYYFLYSPLSLTPWENHPFTLASAEPLPSGGVRLHFLIMPLSGWTGRLLKDVEAGGGQTHVRVLLEGPYGHPAQVNNFDHVLLVAGGSGIAAITPYLATLPGRKVTLVWMTRNAEYAADVFANELAPAAISDVPVELFVTRQDAAAAMSVLQTECDFSSMGIDVGADDERRTAPGVHILPGRPDMRRLVGGALQRLVGDERLAVVACGPGVMLDDLRGAIADSYGGGKGEVGGNTLHYIEEAFVW